MAISINRDMDQGSNFRFIATRKDDNGFALAITGGCTAYCQMRKFYSSDAYISLIASVTGGTGEVAVSLGPTGTAAVKAGVYFYDVELQMVPLSGTGSRTGDTVVQRIVQGMVTVYPEVTKI
jgi:hypothetical protein